MADKEVGDLPSASLPLSGAELLAIVQAGNSRKVAVSDVLGTGLANLDLTVSQLALQVADNTNVALFLGPTGNRVADSLDALTYIDVAGATNADTSTAGLVKPTVVPDTFVSSANPTLTGNNAGNPNSTFRVMIPAAVFTVSGDAVQLTLTPPSTGANHIILNMFIGERSSNADFAGTPTRVTFGGNNGVTLTAGGASVLSDKIIFALDETKDYIISFDNGSTADIREDTGITGYIAYIKSSVAEAGNTTVTGYTALTARVFCVDLVQVRIVAGSTSNLTLRSASFTAATAPTKMKALIRVKEVDAATAGTDYTLECSRDGGTTWATMTLAELFTAPSPTAGIRVVEAAETSVSGQPSGTSPRWRFKTLNNKMIELHDALIYWS